MYVVVIGNLARIVGPFATYSAAQAYAARFDIMSESYDPGRWRDYSVSIARLDAAE